MFAVYTDFLRGFFWVHFHFTTLSTDRGFINSRAVYKKQRPCRFPTRPLSSNLVKHFCPSSRYYWPRVDQYAANTMVDIIKPRTTFTTTPEVNATKGLPPKLANSLNRVVSPMLKKQKINAQVRKSLMGPTISGFTILL